ncbi:hypothetical protein HMPREF9148_00777 [Prevotella sp. F0091]|nr:hypothetical protein HMPREF9148_00777 [Prevotella sp. F0091]
MIKKTYHCIRYIEKQIAERKVNAHRSNIKNKLSPCTYKPWGFSFSQKTVNK